MEQQIPILKLRNTLVVTIQSELHDRAAAGLQTSILEAIERHRVRAVVIDISVLDVVDSFIGRMLSDTARMAAVMNAVVIMVGMQPAVAITLVELGMELEDVRTALSLEAAMDWLEGEGSGFERSANAAQASPEPQREISHPPPEKQARS